MQCIFCDIVTKKTPAEWLYEDDSAIAILDINPIHFGHALIIPKRHYVDFLSLPDPDLARVIQVGQVIARGLVESLGLEGFNIFSNNGRIAGQSVFHFHLHITPRYPDDEIRFVLKLKKYEDGDASRYGTCIRDIIQQQQKSKLEDL